MALVAVDSAAGALIELDAETFGGSRETLAHLLESQKELFHSQIEQLQRLVVVQCKLTGVNPLAQEMAAGALSIKIGKRPRDLLNPKAVKYMQSVFSIKDTIGKKETREISALCGITVSQVREYFSGQRSRVRKLVRLSREKATRSEDSKLSHENCMPHINNSLPDETTIASAENMLIADDALIPVKAGIPKIIGDLQLPVNIAILPVVENPHISGNPSVLATSKNIQESVVATSDLTKVEETHLSSLQEETVPGIDFDDKKFIDDIFNLMGKEKTFSGQVKLMEWILRIQNTAVLNWFLTKGGLTILATWLSQSALEEQTTMIHLILKVFCHLPLQKALPMQMSAILQAVNKLRFYRFSDISHRAKVLLSRWSKQLIRSQALKKPFNSSSKTARNKQRIGDVLVDESWQSKIEIPEDILYLTGTGSNRMSEPKQELKLLPAPGDDAIKKHTRVASLAKSKERRKVLLVEQPDRRSAGRTTQVARITSSNHSRPISADDIQKAKMRAMFMQDKYGKTDAANSGNKLEKKDVHILSTSRVHEVQKVINEDDQQGVSIPYTAPNETENTIDPKQSSSSTLQLDKLNCCKVQWQNPPAVRISSQWCVAVGEKSKEVEVQTQRNKREKETLYSCPQEIPLNPKEPWDYEMDFDDSLTPEIPIEQPPEADISEGPSCSHNDSGCAAGEEAPPDNTTLSPPSTIMAPTTSTQLPNGGASQPDMELLAVLLKNPDLVLALTSNQGKTLTSDEMVALLDMLKNNGNLLSGLMNGSAQTTKTDVSSRDVRQYEPEPTSLPSPTPPSDIARMAWRSQFSSSRAPVLQPFSGIGVESTSIVSQPPVPSLPEVVQARAHSVVLPQAPATTMPSMPQSTITSIPTLQNHSTLNVLTNRHSLPSAPLPSTPSMYPIHQPLSSEASLPSSHRPSSNPSLTAAFPRQDFFTRSESPCTYHTSVLHPASLKPQAPVVLPEPPKFPPKAAAWSATSATSFFQRETTPDQWISRTNRMVDVQASNQHFFSNQNNYNAYSHVPALPPGSLSAHPEDTGGRRMVDGSSSTVETWSSVNDPGRARDSRGRWNHSDPPRRDNGWNDKSEWSRQGKHGGDRDHHRSGRSGGRWRERDYGRQR